jgi:SAM-dependent methyltransferase
VDHVHDPYAGVAPTWDSDAARVYGPIAADLVAATPHALAGRVVLDAGAGTGLVSRELQRAGARVVALDLSVDMLSWRRAERPPGVAGELTALPLCDDAVDDVVAAFVLNHLTEPVRGLRELSRVTRPGGAVLATVYAATSGSPARDRVDEIALAHGFRWPQWYLTVKQAAAPQLENPERMAAAARAAGLVAVDAHEYAADVGIDRAEDLVAYRFGQAHCRRWLDGLDATEQARVRAAAVAAAAPVMRPYRPRVVRLVARSAGPR